MIDKQDLLGLRRIWQKILANPFSVFQRTGLPETLCPFVLEICVGSWLSIDCYSPE
jgi:hypothetical protein